MKEIQLTKGQVTIVDDGDFEYLSQWKWYANKDTKGFYAARTTRKKERGKKVMVLMHREILCLNNSKIYCDHIDGDTLNNRRANLRPCTNAENQRNQVRHIDNSSGFKGVHWHKRAKKWEVQIRVDRKCIYIGMFKEIPEAARAYDEAARKYHGEFANLNFPNQ